MTDELPNPDEKSIIKTTDITNPQNSVIGITDLTLSGINLSDFPVEDFFKVLSLMIKSKNLMKTAQLELFCVRA